MGYNRKKMRKFLETKSKIRSKIINKQINLHKAYNLNQNQKNSNLYQKNRKTMQINRK